MSGEFKESVLHRVLLDLWKLITQQRDNDTDSANVEKAAENNATQVKLLGKKNTIWNVVSQFEGKEGQESWKVVKPSLNKENPMKWMDGKERGVFGETPLHIALLFNNPTEKLEAFFFELWELCPEIQEAIYKEPLYFGENVLHIAIIKKFKCEFIERIVKSRPGLLKQQATGDFFKKPKQSGDSCHNLGEYPLCFAACTNQPKVFQLLIDCKADITVTTREGNNLFHLMVLNAFDIVDAESSSGKSSNDKGPSIVESAFMKMYDTIIEATKKAGCFDNMIHQRNGESHTPLTLAAASGSLSFFSHLFNSEVGIAWVFGPVTCRRLLLKGIDIAVEAEKGESQENQSVLEIMVLNGRKDLLTHSPIDKLVEMKWAKYGLHSFRHKLGWSVVFTILLYLITMTTSHVDVATPGNETVTTCNETATTCNETATKGTAPVNNTTDSTAAAGMEYILFFKLLHTLLHVVAAAMYVPSWAKFRQIVRDILSFFYLGATVAASVAFDFVWALLPAGFKRLRAAADEKELWRQRAELYNNFYTWFNEVRSLEWELVFTTCVPPVMIVLCLEFCWKTWGQSNVAAVCHAVGGGDGGANLALGAVAALSSWPHWSLVQLLVEMGYLAVSIMAFVNILYYVMGFEKYGQFVLMLIQITKQDLPVFVVIYLVFLFGFAHLHFFASNNLHSGLSEGMDSVGRIFGAMLGDIAAEKTEVVANFWKNLKATTVSVVNYFFVTVVLMNLLIAMLSSTYEQISNEAKENWKLHRARLLMRIDQDLSDEDRRDGSRKFWEEEEEDGKTRRFITFNSIEGRSKYLSDGDANDSSPGKEAAGKEAPRKEAPGVVE